MGPKERINHSIFFKIIIIFLTAHLTIVAVGFMLHQYFNSTKSHRNMDKNMVYYGKLLIKQMGLPSDTLKAKKLADSLDIIVCFTKADFFWSNRLKTWPNFPPNVRDYGDKGNTIIASDENGFYLQKTTQTGRYLLVFKTDLWQSSKAIQWRVMSMVLFMMFILTIIYFIIRALLKPLLQLDEAAKQYSNGNLDYRIHTKRKDELGDLVRSFNLMAIRIKAMLKARDQLLLDASHELRSPLTRLRVALEFLEDSSAKQNIRDDINEMETMISELLEKERLDSPYGGLHKARVNVSALVRKVCESFATQKTGIKWHLSDPEIIVDADEERLRLAIRNILQNAFKYSSENIKAVEVFLRLQANTVVIEVQDFGKGIPKKEIPFIFEPFYRVDKSRSKKTGGYGLGMSLVKKIIDAHGGQIEVHSEMNKGTRITIKLMLKNKSKR